MSDLVEREKVIRYLRDEVPLGTFMKRTIANADGACWIICDGIVNDIPTVDAIPVEWMRQFKNAPVTDESAKRCDECGGDFVEWMILEWEERKEE